MVRFFPDNFSSFFMVFMQRIFPKKLEKGDLVRVVAPAHSLGIIAPENRHIADERFASLGLRLSFGGHVEEVDEFHSSSIASRISDLHDAFADPEVKAIFAVIGGFNSNQLLRYINWELIKNNPKVFCGYSDITALGNAIFAKTGLVNYSGPAYATFSEKLGFDKYTLPYFQRCLLSEDAYSVSPSEEWSDDAYYMNQEQRNFVKNAGPIVINEGSAEGVVLGANLCTFNLLQGTEYFPNLNNSVLFIEDDEMANPELFDRDIQSLIHQPGFEGVRGLVIGRFQRASGILDETLIKIIKTKKELGGIPVIANLDFGHTQSMFTFPIGGDVAFSAEGKSVKLEIRKH